MNLEKTIQRHDVAIEKLKDDMAGISSNLSILINEQKHVTQTLKKIQERVTSIDKELHCTKVELRDIKNHEKYKQEFLNRTMTYLRLIAIIAPFILGVITYIAYDWGLYKPVPPVKNQSSK